MIVVVVSMFCICSIIYFAKIEIAIFLITMVVDRAEIKGDHLERKKRRKLMKYLLLLYYYTPWFHGFNLFTNINLLVDCIDEKCSIQTSRLSTYK